MPKIDFSKIDDVENFAPLPEGQYLCRLKEIKEASTTDGDEMWRLQWEVISGPHLKRMIFDNMVFSNKAMNRVKLICSRLGLDVSGELDLSPNNLLNRIIYISVTIGDYETTDGIKRKKNIVPFAGYEKAPDNLSIELEDLNEENIPF